jgi:hypothetical protein
MLLSVEILPNWAFPLQTMKSESKLSNLMNYQNIDQGYWNSSPTGTSVAPCLSGAGECVQVSHEVMNLNIFNDGTCGE